MKSQINRARQGCNPNLALTLNSETTLNLKAYFMLSDSNQRGQYKQVFDPKKLPSPTEYFAGQNLQFIGNGSWKKTICPFHEDTRPSLSVHIEIGAFKCFSCGAKGRDVLAFHRLLHNMSFAEACTDLKVWRSS